MPTPDDDPVPRTADSPYRLPSPLSHRGNLPVAPGAPRVPRALRAFNGMPPAPPPAPPVAGAAAGRTTPPRDGRTIRDLLELEHPAEPVEEGRFAGLRAALGKLRRGVAGDRGDD